MSPGFPLGTAEGIRDKPMLSRIGLMYSSSFLLALCDQLSAIETPLPPTGRQPLTEHLAICRSLLQRTKEPSPLPITLHLVSEDGGNRAGDWTEKMDGGVAEAAQTID